MESLVGIWKLVEARAFDDSGRELSPPFGPHPIGTVTFTTDRMVGVAADGRTSLTSGMLRASSLPIPALTALTARS